MARKKKTYNLKSKITQALRKVWRYHPGRVEALKRAEIGETYIKIAKKSKKEYGAPYYKCEKCKKSKLEKVQVDHIRPVVDYSGFKNWQVYVDRMFVPAEELKILCKPCHEAVTAVQKEVRKKMKAMLK